jgi:small subunit ribosomal protein S6e
MEEQNMEITVNIGDPKTKKTHTFKISADDAKSIYGKKLGDTFRGELFGKGGYEIEITGGSDNAGFPMRRDVLGTARRKILTTRGVGNQQTPRGTRIRKTVSGNTVSDITSQLNGKVLKHGKDPLVEAPAEEAKAEE